MREVLETSVQEALKSGARYAEARISKVFSNRIEVRIGRIERVVPSIEVAGSVRALAKTWGFSSTTKPDEEHMIEAARRSARAAKVLSSLPGREIGLAEVPTVEDEVEMGEVVDPRTIPIDEKLEIVLACDEAARSVDARVVMTDFRYEDQVIVRAFSNSEGTYIREACPFTHLRMAITAREGSNVQTVTGRLSAAAGQELMAYGDPVGMAERLAKRAAELLSAKKAPSGKMRVLVDNTISGLLALCVGVMSSAELASMPGSEMGLFHGKLGQEVASDLVNITDDPMAEGLTVAMAYDDEGVKTKPVKIVEGGILKNYLHSRSTAFLMEHEPNGRARASNALLTPTPLNTNTVMESGDRSIEELLEELKDGLYVVGLVGATVGGIIHCDCEAAYRVEGGQVKEAYRSVSLTFDLLRDLKKIEAVGSDFDVVSLRLSSGEASYQVCGGGPHVLFSELTVG